MPPLESMNQKVKLFALRKIDVTNRNSYRPKNSRGVPHCVVYSPRGGLIEESFRVCWVLAREPYSLLNYIVSTNGNPSSKTYQNVMKLLK